jgi:hypothetical protein
MQAAADSAKKERKNSHKNGTCLGQNWVTTKSHKKVGHLILKELYLLYLKKEPSTVCMP